MPPPRRIVLTGGPCAGKSTALLQSAAWLRQSGLDVYCVPEASTLLLAGGVRVVGELPAVLGAFQRGIVEAQLALENAFLRVAEATGRPSVLLLDRGVPDGAAYVPEATWQALLAELALEHEACRRRYDAVIHLVTAALGAEEHYGTATNAVRYETLEEARAVDERLRATWRGHPGLSVVDNSTDFEVKMRRVLLAVCDAAGVAAPG